jgi:hypothetical protein
MLTQTNVHMTRITLRNIRVVVEPGMISGYENVRIEITNPDSGKTVTVECFDGPAPCVALEHHNGKVYDVVFGDDGGVSLY